MTEVWSKNQIIGEDFRPTSRAAGPSNLAYMPPATSAFIPTDFSTRIPANTKLVVGSHTVTVMRYLSEGGFSHVYLVETQDKRCCVLKRIHVPDKAALQLVHGEIETMKRLKGHRHIVNYIDSNALYSNSANRYEVYLLMEFCAGGGLIDFMNTRLQARLTEGEILKILADVCDAVAAMHYLDPPLIHRDLKIENVLLVAPNSYKLCDFGSVCEPIPPVTTPESRSSVERNIAAYTTPQYRCPEMIDLSRQQGIDEKSDIWAIGVLAYKLCYYTTPFESVGNAAILKASFSFPPFPRYSDRMKRFIATCLQEQPSHRPNIYQSLKEIMEMRGTPLLLSDIYGGVNASTFNPPKAPLLRTPSGRLQPSTSVPSHGSLPPIPISRPSITPKSSNQSFSQPSRTSSSHIFGPNEQFISPKSSNGNYNRNITSSCQRVMGTSLDGSESLPKRTVISNHNDSQGEKQIDEVDILSRYPSVDELNNKVDDTKIAEPIPLLDTKKDGNVINRSTSSTLIPSLSENRLASPHSPGNIPYKEVDLNYTTSTGKRKHVSNIKSPVPQFPSLSTYSANKYQESSQNHAPLSSFTISQKGIAQIPKGVDNVNSEDFIQDHRPFQSKSVDWKPHKLSQSHTPVRMEDNMDRDFNNEFSDSTNNLSHSEERDFQDQGTLLSDSSYDRSITKGVEDLVVVNDEHERTSSPESESYKVQSNVEFLKSLGAHGRQNSSDISRTQRLQKSITAKLEKVKTNEQNKKELRSAINISKPKKQGHASRLLSGKFGDAFKKFEFGNDKTPKKTGDSPLKKSDFTLHSPSPSESSEPSDDWKVESEDLPQVHENIRQYRNLTDPSQTNKRAISVNKPDFSRVVRNVQEPKLVRPVKSLLIQERVRQLLDQGTKNSLDDLSDSDNGDYRLPNSQRPSLERPLPKPTNLRGHPLDA
ncbi:NAK protein kinase Ppk30 [Schizosaccharomyces cryophilus OY26]|uniref:non-specific serine/threonine protein kinase n=1 Tax=Schizosaccharomyces cryophilus (strain OY26 / ATCC MYA-4695 / CBS 11777 / NBRC 106824 / NRRL Y48691) TaxID=653667 RepID=S9W821_SCHCR|nr:NAK protein kinase Ppk30 [Schizosaccharomyces cryophilus OY26]EPY53850.1 NAK protein kinase Ppk30 [Schizosaccharomyces cryophilus OY26]